MQATEVDKLLKNPAELLTLQLPVNGMAPIELQLYKANVLAPGFNVKTSGSGGRAFPYETGAYYWGIVKGDVNSLAAISITRNEIMGFVSMNGSNYVIGKLQKRNTDTHVFYKEGDLRFAPAFDCGTDDDLHYIGNKEGVGAEKDANNCVRMFVEIDNDLVTAKGGVTQAVDYMLGAFSQVAILYANEAVNFTVSEVFAWSTTDPYTGPSTLDYLNQFRNAKNGNYNGDLAHLVGTQGSGGIAYIDVLCNNYYGVGYSDVNLSYSNVPTYSWTIEVLTHEIGHNLGSNHTHACVWNGNNTPIDCCGYNAGYTESSCGSNYNCTIPNPPVGTIMSYCHLTGVGISFSQSNGGGFGPLPRARIQSEVYNAPCLTSCAPPSQNDAGISAITAPVGSYCVLSALPKVTLFNYGSNALTSVTIQYKVDAGPVSNYSWTGNLASNASVLVTLPTITFASGAHTFTANTSNPNGVNDTNTANDSKSSNFNFADDDGDGVCNANDICPGGDDNVDVNNNGIPDFCECSPATKNFTSNPLTHTGAGSKSTSVSFAVGDKDPGFVISNLDAKTNGNNNGRYIDKVTVTYKNGNGATVQYGVFLGTQVNTVNVNISGVVQMVTVKLEDGWDGNYGGTLSVSMSTINYCLGCMDDDNDGVCNSVDQCPGWNDQLLGTACDDNEPCTINDVYTGCNTCQGTAAPDGDGDGHCDLTDNCPTISNPDQADADNDGMGDACENNNCSNEITSNFNPNPLTHAGPGSSSTSITFPNGNSDVSFTINNLNKQGGPPQNRYTELVTVTYTNADGNHTYGVFSGDQYSSVAVNITGLVQTVTVNLTDGDETPTSLTMSITMTAVTSCIPPAPLPGNGNISDKLPQEEVLMYPNPAKNEVTLQFPQVPETAEITLTNMLGMQLGRYETAGQGSFRINLNELNAATQYLLVTIRIPGSEPVTKRLMLIQ